MATRGVLVLCVVLQLVALNRYPAPWFDEGFRFNAGRLLADTGVFGSRSADGTIPFDVSLTSGPLEVGLVAASFKAFGVGVFQGRLPFALLSLLALFLVARIGRDTFGAPAGLLMALTVAAMPPVGEVGFLLTGRQALSETPAMAMLLLGLWLLVRAWAGGRTRWAFAAGAVCGLGILSKSQFAIAILPSLVLVGAARWHLRLESWRRAIAPIAGAVLVLSAWWLAAFLLTGPAVKHSNSALLAQGIHANIVTGLWGSTLSRQAVVMAACCAAFAVWGATRFLAGWRARDPKPGTWLIVMLSSIAAINTVWFVLFSIGWVRYAYLGWIASLMLAGIALHEWLARVDALATARGLRPRWPAITVALASVAVVASTQPILSGAGSDAAARMSAYIDSNVSRGSVVETWEWELSGIGAHTAFHFPSQRYVYMATYQQGRKMPFAFPYDSLVSNPAYLVIGPFAQLTGIYPLGDVYAHFDKVKEAPPYVLFSRRRAPARAAGRSTGELRASTPHRAPKLQD